jgi:UDPglucose 6-dehydrogenase
LSIIEQVERVNHERKIAMSGRIEESVGGSLRGKTVGILGVTFKPNTDDMRDAPSLVIVPMLLERGAQVRVFDPQGRKQAEPMLPGVVWCQSALDVADGADAVSVLTEWNEFRALDLKELRRRMKGNALVDLRNIFVGKAAEEAGLAYRGVGR